MSQYNWTTDMYFADPALGNSAHLTPPTEAPFDAVQHFAGIWVASNMGGTVIGPDLVATSGHIFGSDALEGFEFTSQGVTRQVVSVHRSPTIDALYLKMNGTFPDSPALWNKEPWVRDESRVFVWGVGNGRGAPDLDGEGNLIGWEEGDASTAARRWGAGFVHELYPYQERNTLSNIWRLDLVKDPYCFGLAVGDSGSGVFVDIGVSKGWLFAGVVNGGGQKLFSTPGFPQSGFSAFTILDDIPLLLSLGARVQPASITITNPDNNFLIAVDQSHLLIEGTTIGNPSHITVELGY